MIFNHSVAQLFWVFRFGILVVIRRGFLEKLNGFRRRRF